MRSLFLVAVIGALLLPAAASARSVPGSTIRVLHPSLTPGQAETVIITARDLQGRPLVGARVFAVVHYGRRAHSYHLRPTDRRGVSLLVLHPSRTLGRLSAVVDVTVSNRYLSIPLSVHFELGNGVSSTPTPTRTPAPRPTPTATTPSPSATSSALVIVARAVPTSVTPPNPVWVVAFVHDASGLDLAGATVRAVATFEEGTVSAAGQTDASGSVTLSIDTSAAHAGQTVIVHLQAQWTSEVGSADAQFTVTEPSATPTPDPASAQPTVTATTAASGTPATPTPDPVAVDTAIPTSTTVPTATTAPTETATPVPTDTPSPVPTSTPILTPTPVPGCPASQSACMQVMLGILNNDRQQYAAQYGLSIPALTLDQGQSLGTSNCIGAYGHSVHMAQVGYISHDQFGYYTQGGDICYLVSPVGENVGQTPGGELQALYTMDSIMWNGPGEEHDLAYCEGVWANTAAPNHACNIVNPKYHRVGIGLYESGGATWLTEDFLG